MVCRENGQRFTRPGHITRYVLKLLHVACGYKANPISVRQAVTGVGNIRSFKGGNFHNMHAYRRIEETLGRNLTLQEMPKSLQDQRTYFKALT
jgi:hypothetical protein